MRRWLLVLFAVFTLAFAEVETGRAVGPGGAYFYVSWHGRRFGHFASDEAPALILDVSSRLIALLWGWIVLIYFVDRRRRARRDRSSCCTRCGYDLRGTLHFCPECGTNAELPLERWRG